MQEIYSFSGKETINSIYKNFLWNDGVDPT